MTDSDQFQIQYSPLGITNGIPVASISPLGISSSTPDGGIGVTDINLANNPTAPQGFTDGVFSGNLTIGGALITGKDANTGGVSTAPTSSDIVFWAGATQQNRATAPFRVDAAGNLTATSATVTIATLGGFTIGSDFIRDAANSFGLASTVTGGDDVRFWAGDTFANRATAPARITEAGLATFTNIAITGGSVGGTATIGLANLNIAARGWTQTSVFSVTDADTVAWGTGSFVTADGGTTYSISAGNTGNMAAKTYIYLDIAISTTAYQITTTVTTAVGAGKVLIAVAQNGTGEATFQVLSGQGGQNIDASSIVANSITANEIAASTITGGNIATLNISGKSATFDTGTVGGFTMSATQLTATNFSVTSGASNVANLAVGTGANLAGLNSANAGTDIAFWAGDTFANRATAPFRITAAGDVTATSFSVTGDVSLPLINGVQGTEPTGYRNNTGAAGTLTVKVGLMTMALSGTAVGGGVGIDTDVAFLDMSKTITFVVDFKFDQFTFTGTNADSRLQYEFYCGPDTANDAKNSFGLLATKTGNGAQTLVFSVANGNSSGTQTLTTISPTVAVTNRLVCVYTPSTNIKFYLNGSLVSTSTTNLPATGGTASRFLKLDGSVANHDLSGTVPTLTISRFAVVGTGLS